MPLYFVPSQVPAWERGLGSSGFPSNKLAPMHPVQSTSALTGKTYILPDSGEADETEWRLGSYEQFLRDDTEEDAVYETE